MKQQCLDIIAWSEAKIENPDKYALLHAQLSTLQMLVHDCNVVSEDTDVVHPPRGSYEEIRKVLEENFPELGYYHVADPMIDIEKDAEVVVGNAFDDLADIILDLKEVVWRMEQVSMNDAKENFLWGYKAHWGLHLVQLQSYLYCLLYRE